MKRDEVPANNSNLTVNNSHTFKYKVALVGKRTANHNNVKFSAKDTKIVVPSKYLSNFWRLLEMLLINCKVHVELNSIEYCILSSAGDSKNLR